MIIAALYPNERERERDVLKCTKLQLPYMKENQRIIETYVNEISCEELWWKKKKKKLSAHAEQIIKTNPRNYKVDMEQKRHNICVEVIHSKYL